MLLNAWIKIANTFADAGKGLLSKLSDIETWPEDRLNPSGYTVDTLACDLWSFFNKDSFEECVVFVVNLGGDADMVGAVTGGLACTFYRDIQRGGWRN